MNTNHAKHKLLSILLICVLALSALAGCSQDTGSGSGASTPPSSTETTDNTQGGTNTPSDTVTQSENDVPKVQTYIVGGIYQVTIPTELKHQTNSEGDVFVYSPDNIWEMRLDTSNRSSLQAARDTYRSNTEDATDLSVGSFDGFIWIDDYTSQGGVKQIGLISVCFDTKSGIEKNTLGLVEIKVAAAAETASAPLDDPLVKEVLDSIRAPE